MATKRTKSVGSYPSESYFTTAAKQFSWPIDFTDKVILVPEQDLQDAEDDLMVQHFRKYGWHIQSVIDVERTKIFVKPPVPPKGMFRGDIKTVKQEPEPIFKCNQQFKIVSTGTIMQIVEVSKKGIVLRYVDGSRADIQTTMENLTKSLKMGVFVRI